ncbi:hypothetical protein O7635_09205 [Asanoa sp. WMMD1127]|uniref:hypothetical protein n=1 Tax=Asanoa sp. WMMD1127 TaxID=3016107 RepID=UPI00241706B0|nr:hypothetical protein [Asanoa sp. WMMD1127]MDG4822029.1 hypothetical protein [Asanoa sp. WMMD1127]
MLVASINCQVCANGLVVFTMGAVSGVFLECEECLTGYRSPADLEPFRVEDLDEALRPATGNEVAARGWSRFVLDAR